MWRGTEGRGRAGHGKAINLSAKKEQTMDELTKHPPWKEVVDVISRRVRLEGRGILFAHEELKELLKIQGPKTIEEYKKMEFEYLDAIDNLRNELLVEENIWLENKRGLGYTVISPEEQVDKSADRFFEKARNCVKRAGSLLIYVESDLLSAESEAMRLRKMQKVAFLRAAFRKRKFPQIEEKEQKKLSTAQGK
jgi:hypothetical protein